jgi:hypothetical protein
LPAKNIKTIRLIKRAKEGDGEIEENELVLKKK